MMLGNCASRKTKTPLRVAERGLLGGKRVQRLGDRSTAMSMKRIRNVEADNLTDDVGN
jgi:hypothetical protein